MILEFRETEALELLQRVVIQLPFLVLLPKWQLFREQKQDGLQVSSERMTLQCLSPTGWQRWLQVWRLELHDAWMSDVVGTDSRVLPNLM